MNDYSRQNPAYSSTLNKKEKGMDLIRRHKYVLWVIYFVLCFYCMIDAYQTKMLFDLGAYELNPFLAWLMGITGTWLSILAFKYAALVFLGYILMRYQRCLNKHLAKLGGS